MPFSNTYANNILGWAFGKNSLPNHSKVYIGLCSNDPEADNGTFTELTGGNYARVLVSVNGAAYPDFIGAAASREIKNVKQITWAKASADWTQAKGFGIFNVETGGTPYFYGKLTQPVTCASGEICIFDPEALVMKLSDVDEILTGINTLLGD